MGHDSSDSWGTHGCDPSAGRRSRQTSTAIFTMKAGPQKDSEQQRLWKAGKHLQVCLGHRNWQVLLAKPHTAVTTAPRVIIINIWAICVLSHRSSLQILRFSDCAEAETEPTFLRAARQKPWQSTEAQWQAAPIPDEAAIGK